MVAFAPGLNSRTIGRPSCFSISLPTIRATVSMIVAAGNPMTKRIALVGYCRATDVSPPTRAAMARIARSENSFMVDSFQASVFLSRSAMPFAPRHSVECDPGEQTGSHSTRRPVALTKRSHLPRSILMKRSRSSAVPPMGCAPSLTNASNNSRSANALLTAAFISCTTWGGS